MRRGNSYISSIVKRPIRLCLLVGGVFLSCLFALIPNQSYAITELQGSDDYTIGYSMSTNCFFANYDLGNSFRPTLGFSPDLANTNFQDMCNYSYNNGLGYNSNRPTSSHSFSLSSGQQSYSRSTSSGGYSPFASNPNIPYEIKKSAYDVVNRFGLYFDTSNYYASIPAVSDISSDSYALVGVKFAMDYDHFNHTQVHVFSIDQQSVDTNFAISPVMGATVDTDQVISNLIYSVNSSSLFVCPDSDDGAPTNAFPNGYIDWANASSYCYMFFDIPVSSAYSISTRAGLPIRFPEDNQYQWSDSSGSLTPSRRYFQALIRSVDMASDNYSVDLPPLSPTQFFILTPDTDEEATIFNNFHTVHQYNNENAREQKQFTQVISSYQDSWFDVFKFNFSFPMLSFFNSFTDADCVNIPILAGMLDTSTTVYCSPWKDTNVRSILTPVFSILSAMILSGFIMHWLGSKSSSVDVFDHSTKTKGGS